MSMDARFERLDSEAGKIFTWAEMSKYRGMRDLPPEDLAEIAIGPNFFERGQCVSAKRLRLDCAGIATKILGVLYPERINELKQQARAKRERQS